MDGMIYTIDRAIHPQLSSDLPPLRATLAVCRLAECTRTKVGYGMNHADAIAIGPFTTFSHHRHRQSK